ncbi:MAG TPA: DUF1517 domain-containing protein [Chloroflexota bacterium]|nr:DUF1517 domain-containing protein [Chloroflexota bacterium]
MGTKQRLVLALGLALTGILFFALPVFALGGGVGGGSSFGGGGGGGGSFGGGGGFGGGGFGFPMFIPFLPFGGGGLLPILLFLFYIWMSRQSSTNRGTGGRSMTASSPDVNIIRLEIALLATAKEVPTTLHRLVDSTNTSTDSGLSSLLQQTALLLLRQQQYWHAASYNFQKVSYGAAESRFNALTVQTRSHLDYETITNVNGLRQVDTIHLPPGADAIPPGDYIVVALIVASSAPMRLRQARSSEDIREQLSEIASAAGFDLKGVEVIWQPDSPDEALSRDDLLKQYPELAPI